MWHRGYEDARVSVQLFQLNYLGALCVKDWSFLEDGYCGRPMTVIYQHGSPENPGLPMVEIKH